MKIAVCGIGVAGSYLISRIKDSHEVVGFERMQEEKHDSICAWGASKPKMVELCKKSDVDFEDYVIHDAKNFHVEMDLLQSASIWKRSFNFFDLFPNIGSKLLL